jgi:hypothetical protein
MYVPEKMSFPSNKFQGAQGKKNGRTNKSIAAVK